MGVMERGSSPSSMSWMGTCASLRAVAPAELGEYQFIEKKRAWERLLQVSVEAVQVRRLPASGSTLSRRLHLMAYKPHDV